MMKKTLLALLLCLCVALLAACQSSEPQHFDAYSGENGNQGQQNGNSSAQQTGGTIDFDDGTYDPSSEEGLGAEDLTWNWDPTDAPTQVVTMAPTVHSQYAGATPVIIDPIDKPTATPVPPLTFTYQVYDATNISLSFQGPVGWVEDASATDTYIIYNPDPSMDYAATLTLRAMPVASDYNENAMKSEVQNMLSAIRGSGFSSFSPSNTASRTLIGHSGIYANYTGVLNDGTEVAGRVHVTCIDRVVYTVHITYPRAYTETYKSGVYDKMRDTLKITK